MNREIERYWQEFEAVQDRWIAAREDPTTLREVFGTIHKLAENADREIAASEQPDERLVVWAATFHDFAGQVAVELKMPSVAVDSFRRALRHNPDSERRVRLIQTLCKQGDSAEACREINLSRGASESFFTTGDAECAAKVLHAICNNPELANGVDDSVLRDVVRTVAKRGLSSLSLNPL